MPTIDDFAYFLVPADVRVEPEGLKSPVHKRPNEGLPYFSIQTP